MLVVENHPNEEMRKICKMIWWNNQTFIEPSLARLSNVWKVLPSLSSKGCPSFWQILADSQGPLHGLKVKQVSLPGYPFTNDWFLRCSSCPRQGKSLDTNVSCSHRYSWSAARMLPRETSFKLMQSRYVVYLYPTNASSQSIYLTDQSNLLSCSIDLHQICVPMYLAIYVHVESSLI